MPTEATENASPARAAEPAAVNPAAAKAAGQAPARTAGKGAARKAAGPSPRERLLAAAMELFYAEGVHTVGVDRIIERSGVAKASLYKTFGNKEGLVSAYLDARHEIAKERLERALTRFRTPRERLLGIFDEAGEQVTRPGFRGCAFVAASGASQPGDAIELASDHHRAWMHAFLVGLATEAGVTEPEPLARQLHMLYDGAVLSSRMDRDPSATTTARDAAVLLYDAAPKTSPAPAAAASAKAAPVPDPGL